MVMCTHLPVLVCFRSAMPCTVVVTMHDAYCMSWVHPWLCSRALVSGARPAGGNCVCQHCGCRSWCCIHNNRPVAACCCAAAWKLGERRCIRAYSIDEYLGAVAAHLVAVWWVVGGGVCSFRVRLAMRGSKLRSRQATDVPPCVCSLIVPQAPVHMHRPFLVASISWLVCVKDCSTNTVIHCAPVGTPLSIDLVHPCLIWLLALQYSRHLEQLPSKTFDVWLLCKCYYAVGSGCPW